MAHVEFLASEELLGREAGSVSERVAALYIATRLDAAGVRPLAGGRRFQEFALPIRFLEGTFQVSLETREGRERRETSRNVFGLVEGAAPDLRNEIVVLGAHIDHLGVREGKTYRGAEDNASGVAAVLEVASLLQASSDLLGRSVLAVFFGAEEPYMHGSRAFVREPPVEIGRIAAMVNVDMVGRPLADKKALSAAKALLGIDGSKALGVVGTKGRASFRRIVEAACARAGLRAFAPEDFPPPLSTLLEEETRDRGDHAAFERAGIPTLFFGSGESDDYHAPTDTPERLDPSLMARRAQAIYAAVLALSVASELPAARAVAPASAPAPPK
ncbi:MAG TPA: M20/M25/M40 family metallo-hydrolase [Planctomycetota bacterium]|jgi:Zn-dependent M28 family amino/carboxypeptidase|nr:M20/M25/M40 family metallo-hydrolase [Planctomycetota bacterium]